MSLNRSTAQDVYAGFLRFSVFLPDAVQQSAEKTEDHMCSREYHARISCSFCAIVYVATPKLIQAPNRESQMFIIKIIKQITTANLTGWPENISRPNEGKR